MGTVWRKLGQVFCPSSETEWMISHAAVPIAQLLEGNLFRIYFSCRDRQNRSFTSYVIIDLLEPRRVIELATLPILAPGELGTFDDSGAMATWRCDFRGVSYLYYIGWNLGVTVPFRNAIGVATSISGVDYRKIGSGPIVDRTLLEPHFTASCCVIPSDDCWRMWYLSCVGWKMTQEKPVHKYHIKYAESKNGLDWHREGTVAVDFCSDDEFAISRPSVVRDGDLWRMWYSFRGESYRIGYAESFDGRVFKRKDSNVGIDVSTTGWDSEMVCYPFVFKHNGQLYMLYNGNQYGKTGFGLAVCEHV